MKLEAPLLAILVGGALARGYAISRPWAPDDHNGWGGAFYSNIARNYTRYGLIETRLAPVITTGETPRERWVYYLTHPPFIGLGVAASFRVFGEKEWAARLVPLAFSVASIVLVYLLGEGLFSRGVGLFAALFAAFVPMGIVYGAHVDPQGAAVTFFSLAMLEAYRRGRRLAAILALVVGAGFDWPVHYMSGLIALHALVSRDETRRWALTLPAVSLLWVSGYLAYSRAVAPRPEQHYLGKNVLESFSFWSGREVDPKRIPGYRLSRPGSSEWLGRVAGYYAELFTPPLLFLAAWGGILAIRRREGAFLALLAAWGALHVALFPMGAFVHDYWSDYLTPALALGGAVGARELVSARKAPALLASGALLVLFLYLGLSRIERTRRERPSLGPWLHERLAPEEGVLSLLPLDVRDTYYADRPFRDGVNRLASFEAAAADPLVRYRYFLVPEDFVTDRPEKPLFQELEKTYPRFRFESLFVYDLLRGERP